MPVVVMCNVMKAEFEMYESIINVYKIIVGKLSDGEVRFQWSMQTTEPKRHFSTPIKVWQSH